MKRCHQLTASLRRAAAAPGRITRLLAAHGADAAWARGLACFSRLHQGVPPRLHRALACAARREPAPHSRRKRSQPWNGGVIARRRVLCSRYAAAVATAAGRAPRPRARFWQPGAQERISRDDGQPAAEPWHVGSKRCAPIHGNSVQRRSQPSPSAGWKVVCSALCSCAFARVQRPPTETVAPLHPLAASERRPTVCVCRPREQT